MALFIALSLVQVIGQFTVAEMMYGGKIDIKAMFKNPVIIATSFGLIFNYFNISFPSTINVTFELLSQVAIPLILFALGASFSGDITYLRFLFFICLVGQDPQKSKKY